MRHARVILPADVLPPPRRDRRECHSRSKSRRGDYYNVVDWLCVHYRQAARNYNVAVQCRVQSSLSILNLKD